MTYLGNATLDRLLPVDDVPEGSELLPLTGVGGQIRGFAIVDADDADWLSGHRWHLLNRYACRRVWVPQLRKSHALYMHRAILGLKPGDPQHTDHINRNRLDNRRANLRRVKHIENCQNLAPINNRGTSRFRGVTWSRSHQHWYAQQKTDGQMYWLGSFPTEEAAAAAVARFRAAHMPFSEEARVVAEAAA